MTFDLITEQLFSRDAMHSAACRRAVSVRLTRSCTPSKRVNIVYILLCSPSGSHTILVLCTNVTATFRRGLVKRGRRMQVRYDKMRFRSRCISQMTPIGTRGLSNEWYHFQWPWVNSDLDFKVMITIQHQVTRNWYKIKQWQDDNDTKSYMIYWLVPLSMTLNVP